MTASTFTRDDLMPPPPTGLGRGLALAVLAHALLLIGLGLNMDWRTSEPEGLEAELWAAVPQIAAPRAAEPQAPQPKPTPAPPPPPPAPPPKAEPVQPDPQIAIEKAKQEKLKEREREKLEQQKEKEKDKLEEKKREEDKLKADKAYADRRKKEEANRQKQLDAQREANIKRILGQAGASGDNPAGTASHTAGPSAGYAGRIKARVKPNILLTADTIDGNPTAEVEVKAAPDGTIIARTLIKSSGSKEWDEAVLRAIDKTEILPRDTDGRVPSPMVLAFRPRDF